MFHQKFAKLSCPPKTRFNGKMANSIKFYYFHILEQLFNAASRGVSGCLKPPLTPAKKQNDMYNLH